MREDGAESVEGGGKAGGSVGCVQRGEEGRGVGFYLIGEEGGGGGEGDGGCEGEGAGGGAGCEGGGGGEGVVRGSVGCGQWVRLWKRVALLLKGGNRRTRSGTVE